MSAKPDLNCRLLCASAAAYLIQPGSPSGQYDPSKGGDMGAAAQYQAVGYSEDPWIISDGIDAVLVGKTDSEVIVAFRGTLPPAWNLDSVLDWLNDIILAEPVSNVNLPGMVHSGFLRTLLSVGQQTAETVAKINTAGLPVYLTGHSKGGGVAPIAALYLNNVFQMRTANVVTFAGPRPGDADFASAYDKAFPGDIRYENYLDLVPLLPPTASFANLAAALLSGVSPELAKLLTDAAQWNYADVGTLRYIEADSQVVADYPGLIDIRIAEILEKLATLNLAAIGDAHLSACYHGYMNGVCAGGGCPAQAH